MSVAAVGRKKTAHEVSHAVIACALRVHTALGPGLLESAYEACLAHELAKGGLSVGRQVELPVVYDGITLDIGYRIDLLVEDLVIVELKAIDSINDIHKAQIISYLKLSGKSLGLIINFHVTHLKDGIKRFVEGKKEFTFVILRALCG
jgi:GxxExxY protein